MAGGDRHCGREVAQVAKTPAAVDAHRLGHSDPAVTLRVNAHAVKPADEAVAEDLGRIVGGRD